jgi:adenylyltransferase/sulfurtransferase
MIEIQKDSRYQRQILLPGFGEVAQQKLLESKVLVTGAGGLGCPVLLYLAAAGVGTIGIVDDDVVSLTNLHRQVLYTTDDIGLNKAERAASALRSLNPNIQINPYKLRLTNANALGIIQEYDIVVDGTDNFSTRYMINDACVLLNKPLVYAAISRFEGQVAIFNSAGHTGKTSVNYRDLFPNPPADGEIMNCAEAGVLGVVASIIGSMQANETIKLITGIGQPLINRLLTYNALNNQLYEVSLTASEETASYIPKDKAAFLRADYDWACSANSSSEIDADEFNSLLGNKYVTIIDVREKDEMPLITEFPHLHIPLGQLKENSISLDGEFFVTFCQSGGRSMKAAELLFDTFGGSKKVYSLKSGIINWKNRQSN